MSILSQLSSQTGDRSEASNGKVVQLCLEDPARLAEIGGGLAQKNAALAGDCAEVMTQVALVHPVYIAPFFEKLAALLEHKTTRVRWEAVHALALVAAITPAETAGLLPRLAELMRTDASIIVRDYAIDAVANYAGSSREAAGQAYPVLKEALAAWGGRHAGHALIGLAKAAAWMPEMHSELRTVADEYSRAERGVVRKAAGELAKAAGAAKR
jgi:hypothetical protein